MTQAMVERSCGRERWWRESGPSEAVACDDDRKEYKLFEDKSKVSATFENARDGNTLLRYVVYAL
jgi:hypothetical protein